MFAADSGHGTMREMTELDWQDGMSGDDEITSSTPHKIRPMYHVNAQTLNQDEVGLSGIQYNPCTIFAHVH